MAKKSKPDNYLIEQAKKTPVHESQNHQTKVKGLFSSEPNFVEPIKEPITKNKSIGSSRMYWERVKIPTSIKKVNNQN